MRTVLYSCLTHFFQAITDADKKEIVDRINYWRSRVKPTATNMQKVVGIFSNILCPSALGWPRISIVFTCDTLGGIGILQPQTLMEDTDIVFLPLYAYQPRNTPGVSENPMRCIPTIRNTTNKVSLLCLLILSDYLKPPYLALLFFFLHVLV